MPILKQVLILCFCVHVLSFDNEGIIADGQGIANGSLEQLEKLQKCVFAGRQLLTTWQGLALISQSRIVRDPKVAAAAAEASRDDAPRDGDKQDSHRSDATVLKGAFLRTMQVVVEFKTDCVLGSSWSRWKADPTIQLKSLETDEVYEQANDRPLDVISIVTPEFYYSYDLQSKVVALNDPTGTGEILAVKSSRFHRFAVKWPAERAKSLTERAHVFVPMMLYEVSGAMPDDLLRDQANLVKAGESSRSAIEKDPNDNAVTIGSVAYKKNAGQMGHFIQTRYRQIDDLVAVVEAVQARDGSADGQLAFTQSVEWKKIDDVMIPVRFEKKVFGSVDGSPTFSREVKILNSEVNGPLDPTLFSEQGLELAEGDFLQARPSKDVQVQTQDGLKPVAELIRPVKQSAANQQRGKWIVIASLLIITIVGAAVYRRRQPTTHNQKT